MATRRVVLSLRNKSNKSSRRSRQTAQEEEEEEDEEESDLEDEYENDPNIVKDYKDLEKVVQSLRYDVIMKAGLDMARNKVEDAFYNNELRLNGEKLWKKSRTVKVGDTLDLLVGEDKETGTAVVMRVVLKKLSDKTESEKYKDKNNNNKIVSTFLESKMGREVSTNIKDYKMPLETTTNSCFAIMKFVKEIGNDYLTFVHVICL
ncbi:hypothetical protein BTVI_92005 [Pitangus sulphuratus]|nr:hypothetical protein BTVI_92005 [Pitangus sulphuratus]